MLGRLYLENLPSLSVQHLNFTEKFISTDANRAESVFAVDVDGDGDMDVLSASQQDDKIAWYENTMCGDGFTYFEQLPATATILDGNFCLSDVDLAVLSTLITENNLVEYDDSTALEVGNQTWSGGRLKILQASYSPSGTNGVNTQLTKLPDNFGDLSELALTTKKSIRFQPML